MLFCVESFKIFKFLKYVFIYNFIYFILFKKRNTNKNYLKSSFPFYDFLSLSTDNILILQIQIVAKFFK